MNGIDLIKISSDGVVLLVLGILLRALFSKLSALELYIFDRDKKIGLIEKDIEHMRKTLDAISEVRQKK